MKSRLLGAVRHLRISATVVALFTSICATQQASATTVWGYEYEGSDSGFPYALYMVTDETIDPSVVIGVYLDYLFAAIINPFDLLTMTPADLASSGNLSDYYTPDTGSTTILGGINSTTGDFSILASVFNGAIGSTEFACDTLSCVETVNGFFGGEGDTSLQAVAGSSGTAGIVAVSAVPIPAAAWLFGSGLLGLVGMARRKKT